SMLETIREYALERLESSGEAEAVRRAHAGYYRALVGEAERAQAGPREVAWLNRLEQEHDNLRAVLAWSLDGGDLEVGLEMAGALVRFWHTRGHLGEGRRWLEPLLARSSSTRSGLRAKALHAASVLAWEHGDYPAATHLEEQSLALARELGDIRSSALALAVLGILARDQG